MTGCFYDFSIENWRSFCDFSKNGVVCNKKCPSRLSWACAMERVPKPEWGWYYTLRLVLAPRASNIVSLQLGPGDVDDVIILAGFDGLRDTKDEVEAFDAADNQRIPAKIINAAVPSKGSRMRKNAKMVLKTPSTRESHHCLTPRRRISIES